ncbi:LacI family transcriptional regulator [Paenarthrobacter sp. MMS21-TAE1-1]|uniref:LacI family transcriptional regulator n=1 Tax=Paenarthrobacter aromaticivorans TaxID=2849150 RepID=A0ABS6IBG8_9MICC|nr:LacI family transcriptional regulator [Paenarthrobacter sp. MMS21-TAE1-1]
MALSPDSKNRRVTIKDVARKGGVSTQTVTRAINDMPGINIRTKDRIRKLAEELGYTPSRFAKGLVQGAGSCVGMVVPELTNPYFHAVVSSVVHHATQRGWQITLNEYPSDADNMMLAIEQIAAQVDAVIGWSGSGLAACQRVLGRRPLVLLDPEYPGAAGEVSFDYVHAAQLTLNHLISQGRTRISYLDSSPPQGLSVRAQAFARQAGELGLPLTFLSAEGSAKGARTAVSSLTETNLLPDALIAFNDVTAIGAIKALAAAGRSVPRECSVIGMDGIAIGELLTPELTTVSIDFNEIGATTVQLVEDLLDGKVPPGAMEAKRTLKYHMVLRQSS